MWEVLDVLQRRHKRESIKRISRQTRRSKNTVKLYLAKAKELGWVAEIHEPTEKLAAEVKRQLKPGPVPGIGNETNHQLDPHREQIRSWLFEPARGIRRPLTLTKVHILLTRMGIFVSYPSLYRYAKNVLGYKVKGTTVRMAPTKPGEVAEADFGYLGLIPDQETGRMRKLWALIVTLVWSRHQYAHLTHGQTIRDFFTGLEAAWNFFGGIPERLVIDNLTPAIRKADHYDPAFTRTALDYARYHKPLVIDPCAPDSPKQKPVVERGVPYVRNNFFAAEDFRCLDHAQHHALHWCTEIAGQRIHGSTRQKPLDMFEIEKESLAPLKGEPYDIPQWGNHKVHQDCCIRFNHALYSVPHSFCGQKALVQANTKLVRIYVGGELVKTHPRKSPGSRSIDHEDYPKEKSIYTMRSIDILVNKAEKIGTNAGLFARRLFEHRHPWSKIRSAYKLLNLAKKYGADRTDASCKRALDYDLINVYKLDRILKQALDLDQPDIRHRQPVQMSLRFLRENTSFNHQKEANHEH